jgi:hypothetical protein
MALSTCCLSCPSPREESDHCEKAEQMCLEIDERVHELARPAREAASRLATAEAILEAVSRDIDARSALVNEIEALDGEIKETAWARSDATGRGAENRLVEVAPGGIEELLAEKEARRSMSVERLVALRSSEPDARLEAREALALSARELARAHAKRAAADFDAATSELLLNEWVKAVVESWWEVIQVELAGNQTASLS